MVKFQQSTPESLDYNCSQKYGNISVRKPLNLLRKRWKISQQIYDLQIGKRNDVADKIINVNGVRFHIPLLTQDDLFVLWRCLWPDCHNCCEQLDIIPLTKDDIDILSRKMNYNSKIDFINKETIISSWTQKESYGNFKSVRTHISLKRKCNESENDEGKLVRCRFLNSTGCGINSCKPSVCSMYPFVSYLENDGNNGRSIVHALFQFTGNCPGFYLDKSLDSMMPVIIEYSNKIYNYTMEYIRAQRENYCVSSEIIFRKVLEKGYRF